MFSGHMAPIAFLLIALRLVNVLHARECKAALGMEEGRIPDHAISASSSYEIKSVGPQNARIRQEKNGGAWCPKAQISGEVREFLEVDLARNHLITWTETQGRFGNGQGQEYAEAFLIEYWRDSLDQWILYKDSRGERILTGNSNTYLVVKQRLELPFVASRVRFIPYSEHPRTVCMRVELYGCPWEQNIAQYTAPQGEIRDGIINLEDFSYDGILDDAVRYMHGGLGQLVDGLYGDDDYENNVDGEKTGSRWIGWNNDTIAATLPTIAGQSPLVNIIFEFTTPQELTAVHIHTNNMFTRGVQVFSSIQVSFSLDGEKYLKGTVEASPSADRQRENARNISISLQNRVASFVKITLTFATKWILISEITFDAVPVVRNISDEFEQIHDVKKDRPNDGAKKRAENTQARTEHTPATSPTSNHQAYIGLITGVLAMVVLLLACTIFLMVRRGRRKVAMLHKHTALVSSCSTKPGAAIGMNDLKMNVSTTIITESLSRSRMSIKSRNGNGNVNGNFCNNGSLSGSFYGNREESDSENSSVYHEPYKLLNQDVKDLSKKDKMPTSKSECLDFNSFHKEDIKFSSPSFYNLPLPPPTSRPPPAYYTPTKSTPSLHAKSNATSINSTLPVSTNHLSSTGNYYAATDIVKTKRKEQHFTPGHFTPIRIPDGPPLEGVAQLLDFPRNRLRVLEKLGEGAFGTVHLCEAEGIHDFNSSSTYHKKQIVVVKSLWRGCSENVRKEFLRESSWMAGLRDTNIARIVGICKQDEPMCTVIEHSDLGELPVFLQKQSTETGSNSISYGCLIYLATQVASGMKYMEAMELVHRDLAARNCVIDKSFTVKVSDHAMYCDRYNKDYYLSDTKCRLPIRWMSWESLLLGQQSLKSDVWAFAVTLWEILMLSNQQPFADMTNEQVVENASKLYQNTNSYRYLPRPTGCPKEIYDLMAECWKRNVADRPRFSEIYLFLQRKNLGYTPAPVAKSFSSHSIISNHSTK